MGASVNLFSLQSLRQFKGRLVAVALLPLLFATPVANADEAAVQLLNKMNIALHKLNYKGTLAYLRDNTLSSLHIEHSVVNGIEGERVVRLNEAGDEISRELQGFSLASIPNIRPEMEAVYSFDMGRENRVANIPCRIITARPKDRKRYLQKYCIDLSTGMLLDYMLVGKSHKPVEQFMFTRIEIQVPKEEVAQEKKQNKSQQTEEIINATTALAKGDSSLTDGKIQLRPGFRFVSSDNLDDGWVMEALPAGFEISQAPSMKSMSESEVQAGETKHYIVTDGLSSLSVFVSPFTKDAPVDALKVNSGALNIVTQKKGDTLITAVGEVPEVTLKNIVEGLRKK